MCAEFLLAKNQYFSRGSLSLIKYHDICGDWGALIICLWFRYVEDECPGTSGGREQDGGEAADRGL